jgi:hypothetical protein
MSGGNPALAREATHAIYRAGLLEGCVLLAIDSSVSTDRSTGREDIHCVSGPRRQTPVVVRLPAATSRGHGPATYVYVRLYQ